MLLADYIYYAVSIVIYLFAVDANAVRLVKSVKELRSCYTNKFFIRIELVLLCLYFINNSQNFFLLIRLKNIYYITTIIT